MLILITVISFCNFFCSVNIVYSYILWYIVHIKTKIISLKFHCDFFSEISVFKILLIGDIFFHRVNKYFFNKLNIHYTIGTLNISQCLLSVHADSHIIIKK